MRVPSIALFLCLSPALWLSSQTLAQPPAYEPGPPPSFEPAPPPPPPPASESGDAIEPEITIRPGPEGTITEYRVNGELYMIKVTPAARGFPSYYLVDTDGDGRLDTRRAELQRRFLIPAWVIHRW